MPSFVKLVSFRIGDSIFSGVIVFGRQRSPGYLVVVFGILLIVFAGVFALANYSRNSQAANWEDESPLDTSRGAIVKRKFVVAANNKALRYMPVATLALGLIFLVVGGVMELA